MEEYGAYPGVLMTVSYIVWQSYFKNVLQFDDNYSIILRNDLIK